MNHVHLWKQAGKLSLWRYTENRRNFPGWHLTADAIGCRSLVELLDAFASDGVAASCAVEIMPPSKAQLKVPNNREGKAAWEAPNEFRIRLVDDPAAWSFPLNRDPAVLAIGDDWLASLREGISGCAAGRGDYSIGRSGKDSAGLWFWW